MTAYRKNARSGLANVAAHEQQIAKHLDRENTGTVLREAHAITGDNRPGVAIDACCRFYGRTSQAGARFDLRPLEVVHACHEGAKPLVCCSMNSTSMTRSLLVVFASSSMVRSALDMPTSTARSPPGWSW